MIRRVGLAPFGWFCAGVLALGTLILAARAVGV